MYKKLFKLYTFVKNHELYGINKSKKNRNMSLTVRKVTVCILEQFSCGDLSAFAFALRRIAESQILFSLNACKKELFLKAPHRVSCSDFLCYI